MRLKEHCRKELKEKGMMDKLAIADNAWENHQLIHKEETLVLDNGRGQKLLVKEAIHIQECFNQDGVIKFHGCWKAMVSRQKGVAILASLHHTMFLVLQG